MKTAIVILKGFLVITGVILMIWVQIEGMDRIGVYFIGHPTYAQETLLRFVGVVLGIYIFLKLMQANELRSVKSELVLAQATIQAYEAQFRSAPRNDNSN